MKIIPITPRGYCAGVVRAIEIAKKTAEAYPREPIYMLGMIVHNQTLVRAIEDLGIICLENRKKTRLELLDEIESGVVIITAHGASDAVFQKAQEKGLTIVDATCKDVNRTHILVREHVQNGDVIFIGKKNHPEAEGITQISNRVHLISSIEDLKGLPPLENVLITTQTTLSILDTKDIIDACQQYYPDAKLELEICNATRIRQEAVMQAKDVDTLIVVGDPLSNNTNQLCTIGKNVGIPNVYMIETVSDLKEEMVKNKNQIAVTSGSSTPTQLTQEVIDFLDDYAKTGNFNPTQYQKPISL